MDMQNKLGLEIPERTPVPEGSFLSKPREVEQWISSLPTANINETSRQVFKTIVEFNRMEIPNLPRIKAAEMFRRPIRYLTENLKKFYFDSQFPLSAKNRKIAVLNRELYMELAIAYKIVIIEMISGEARKIDRKLLIVAIQRAMRSLTSVLYQSVIVYDPFPDNTWGEIHRLYAYAEQNRVHDLTVKDAQHKGLNRSIRDIYIQAMLFSVISPYRFRQREIDHCYSQLVAWSARTSLTATERVSSSPSTLFISRLNTNDPPTHLELQATATNRFCRQLNTINLVRLLQSVLDSVDTDENREAALLADDPGHRQLLSKLIQVLSRVQKRKYVRTRLNFELKIAVGLSAIHNLLCRPDEADEAPVEKQSADEEGIEWFKPRETQPLINVPQVTEANAHIGLGEEQQYNQVAYDTVIALDEDGVGYDGGTPLPAWVASAEKTPEPFSCTTDNESAWGYCIAWPTANSTKIKVGELLGIHVTSNNTNQLRIGMSRWLRNLPGHGIQVGLEIIGLDSVAVKATLDDTNTGTPTSVACILLPASQTSGQSATLLTPMRQFTTGDQVLLDQSGVKRPIRLTRLLESTGTFCRYQFKDAHITSGGNQESAITNGLHE